MRKLIFTLLTSILFLTISYSQTNQLPKVLITAPTKYTVIYSNQTYTVTANATDLDGSISKVEFYAGNILVGTDTEAPYSAVVNTSVLPLPTWNFADWNITVKAYDNAGGMSSVTTPSNVWLSMRPTNDAGIVSGGFDGRGSQERTLMPWIVLKKNGFLVDITSVTIGYKFDNEAEKIFNWTGKISDPNLGLTVKMPTIPNSNGPHTLTYRIISRNGQASDEISANDTYTLNFTSSIFNKALPVVSLKTPVASQYVTTTIFDNQSYTFTATASDPDGWVKKVEFFVNGESIGVDETAPYEITKSNLPVGTYSIVAKATDDTEGVGTSLTAKLVVKPGLDVSISAIAQPQANSTTTTVAPVVTVRNQGNTVINSFALSYTLDGGEAKGVSWTGTLAPNATTNVTLPSFRNENGSHTLVANVSNPNNITDGDNSNNSMTRNFVSAVNNSAPTARMATPSYISTTYDNASFTFAATATDRDGWITKVEFYLGSQLIGTDTEAPYGVTSSNIAVGKYACTIKAYDDRNAVTTSSVTTLNVLPSLNVSINGITQPSTAPTTTNVTPIISIKNLGSVTVTSATVSYQLDGGEVKSVNWTGSLAPNAVTNVSLPVFRNENGSHSIVFNVSNPNGGIDGDNSNNSMTRDFVSTVNNAAPTARVTTPSYISRIKSNETFTLAGSATDRDGWITKVEFYLGNQLVGTDTEAPYALTLNTWVVGTWAVTIKSYDDRSAVTTSAATTLIVSQGVNSNLEINNSNFNKLNSVKEADTVENTSAENTENTPVSANITKVSVAKSSSMTIYPNPATDYTSLNINAAEEGVFNLIIIDMAGKAVQTKKLELNAGENTINLDLSSIANGVYMVSLNKGALIINKKLVINN